MKYQVTFTVDVDFLDEDLGPVVPGDPLDSRIARAVGEAVSNAMERGNQNGHDNEMNEIIAILADSDPVVKRI